MSFKSGIPEDDDMRSAGAGDDGECHDVGPTEYFEMCEGQRPEYRGEWSRVMRHRVYRQMDEVKVQFKKAEGIGRKWNRTLTKAREMDVGKNRK
jgi:hypothetical protein